MATTESNSVSSQGSWLSRISDTIVGLPGWPRSETSADGHPIRVEEDTRDGHFQIRAELPGMDPQKDVDVTVCDGRLTITAQRSERQETNGRSEFRYGSFVRTVTLPAGADLDTVEADYDRGILTVDVAVTERPAPEVKHVAVRNAGD